jgi:pyruvate formate lyase activating enzyme
MNDQESLQNIPLEAASPYVLRVGQGRAASEIDIKSALATGDMGFLHSFTTGSAVDGPGIRVVCWTSGCNFQCLYCHNPDTWKLRNGLAVTLEKATSEIEKYRAGLKLMAGGLTISGGEPLMQDRFVINLFAEAKRMGIHTALDTNGSLGGRLTNNDLDKIDLVLLDIKAWKAENHMRLTAHQPAQVIDFARRLSHLKKPVWIRFVLVPGYTDDTDEVKNIAKFAAELGNVERVDVLPFHQMGRFKWKELEMDYALDNTKTPDRKEVELVCDIFRNKGLKAF